VGLKPGQALIPSIREEQGTEVSDSMLTPLRLARRRLMWGEPITASEFARETDSTTTNVIQAARVVEALGFVIERTSVAKDDQTGPGRHHHTQYRVTNTDHVPSDEQITAAAIKEQQRRSTQPARRRRRAAANRTVTTKAPALAEVEAVATPGGEVSDPTGIGVALPPLPDLGQSVTVYALALDPDGEVTVGLRNGTRQWLLRLVGTGER
jgi:hypothetical protein